MWTHGRKQNTIECMWDFFIAHAAADNNTAMELYDILSPNARVFLDSRCLLPGDDWDHALLQAQRKLRITIVMVSSKTEKAYYQREEIAAAIDLARRNNKQHRVVPIYLDGWPIDESPIPYGLRLKHGIALSGIFQLGRRSPISTRDIETFRAKSNNHDRAEPSCFRHKKEHSKDVNAACLFGDVSTNRPS